MPKAVFLHLRAALIVAAVSCFLAVELSAQVDPRQLGFNIPPGPIQGGEGRRVTTNDDAGRAVVGKLHVEVGQNRIVMLPDGQLVVRKAADAPNTDRRFEPAKKDTIAEELLAGPLKGFQTKQKGRYLFVYNTSKGFADTASIILETMLRGVMEHVRPLGVTVRAPEVPLIVIMFRKEDDFQKFRRMPAGIVAYYNIISNQVVLYEESKLWKVNPRLAVQQALSTIAHEGAHQILHNIGVQQRLSVWPMWLSEGLAEYLAPTTTGKSLRWKGAGQINDLRMFELERYLTSKRNGWDGKTIEHTVAAARLTSTGYASAWALTHYLAKRQRTKFNELIRQSSKLGPLEGSLRVVPPGVIPDNVRGFKKLFGGEFADLEERLFRHLQGQRYIPPFANSPHFVAAIRYPNGRGVAQTASMFFSKASADQWLQDAIAKLTDEQREAAQSGVRKFPNRVEALKFTRLFWQ